MDEKSASKSAPVPSTSRSSMKQRDTSRVFRNGKLIISSRSATEPQSAQARSRTDSFGTPINHYKRQKVAFDSEPVVHEIECFKDLNRAFESSQSKCRACAIF